MTALIGNAVARGDIDLEKSMQELGIDDRTKLNAIKKSARYKRLIKARSGVYLPAAYETAVMAAKRHKRGSHKPGEFWYYNNWDFNVAGRLYEMNTGKNIHIAFKSEIADAICMQDYDINGTYLRL